MVLVVEFGLDYSFSDWLVCVLAYCIGFQILVDSFQLWPWHIFLNDRHHVSFLPFQGILHFDIVAWKSKIIVVVNLD